MSAQDRLYALAKSMSGSFSSQQQAASDENFLSIALSMSPIWEERVDGYWFYVEQAASNTPKRPYRQRLYQVTFSQGTEQQHGEFVSRIFTLPKQLEGYHYEPDTIELLQLSDVEELQGCRLILREQQGYFAGGTVGSHCKNTWGGACFATSEATIYPNRLLSLDKGYAENYDQVWGSEFGPYCFDKLQSLPLTRKDVGVNAPS